MNEFLLSISPEVKALLDSIHNPIIAIDTTGRAVYCNHAFEKIVERSTNDIVGQELTALVADSQLYRILQTGKQELAKKLVIEGHTFMSNRTIFKVGDKIIGAVAILQDISELKSLSSELEHTRQISDERRNCFTL